MNLWYRIFLIWLTQDGPMGRHLEWDKTEAHVMHWYFWASLHKEVSHYWNMCLVYQVSAAERPQVAPMVVMPVIEKPFEWTVLVAGTFLKSSMVNQRAGDYGLRNQIPWNHTTPISHSTKNHGRTAQIGSQNRDPHQSKYSFYGQGDERAMRDPPNKTSEDLNLSPTNKWFSLAKYSHNLVKCPSTCTPLSTK